MVLASYLSVAFFVGAVGAWHLLPRPYQPRRAQDVFHGDVDGGAGGAGADRRWATCTGSTRCNTSPPRSPRWKATGTARRPAPLILFGLPNMKTEHTDYAIEIPHARQPDPHPYHGTASYLGLKDFPPADRPYSPVVFWSFRIMVGLGFLMLALGLLGLVLRSRRAALRTRWLQRAALAMAPAGFVALLSGWVTTEVGRQPFTVYGAAAHGRQRLADRRCPAWRHPWPHSESSICSCSAPGSCSCCASCAKPPVPGEYGPASRIRRGQPASRRGRRAARRTAFPVAHAGGVALDDDPSMA